MKSLRILILILLTFNISKSCQAAFVRNSKSANPTSFLLSPRRTMSPAPQSTSRFMSASLNTDDILERTATMDARSTAFSPLTDLELNDIIVSIQNIIPTTANINYDELRTLLSKIGHLSHKDWARTGESSERIGRVLFPEGMCFNTRQMLRRILDEGNWNAAEKHATEQLTIDMPWAVLVTGVNGIRKTTSMYQPWFQELLAEALTAPDDGPTTTIVRAALPCGDNSFFRQLDHMIATLCNEDFSQLYALTGKDLKDGEEPSKELIQKYSNLKAAIFTRYRTLSELLGVWLLREAQKLKANCMMETSGRDVAMFHYVDHFFPKHYKKLALHFTINDLSCAQQSVDARMVTELKDGIQALKSKDVFKVVYANAGGPYGSEVLAGVQEASDQVWNEVVMKGDQVGQDWYKATIAINAHPTEPWSAQAVRPDGSLGKKFVFENR